MTNVTIDQPEKDLTLPLGEKMFAEVILNFLGQKEELTYIKVENFILIRNNIEILFYAIHDKVSREHNVFIEHFITSVFYEDGTADHISGIENLKRYNDNRDSKAEAINLSWNIIFKYPEARTIENQKINLTLESFSEEHGSGIIHLEITHTNKAWAMEIKQAIENLIYPILSPNKAVFNIIKRSYELLTHRVSYLIFLMIVLMSVLSFIAYYSESVIETQSKYFSTSIEKHIENISLWEINSAIQLTANIKGEDAKKLEKNKELSPYIQEILSRRIAIDKESSSLNQAILVPGLGIPLLYIFIVLLLSKLKSILAKKSFILINDRSEKEYNYYRKSKKSLEKYSIFSLLFAITCSIVASFIYSYIV